MKSEKTIKNKSLLRILGLGLSATQGMECPRLIRATFIDTAVMCNLRVSAGEHEELHSMQLNVSSNGHGM